MTEQQINAMAKLLADESRNTWEAGLQNCSRPLTEEEARDAVKKTLANLILIEKGETELVG
jgi:hypothetical protein